MLLLRSITRSWSTWLALWDASRRICSPSTSYVRTAAALWRPVQMQPWLAPCLCTSKTLSISAFYPMVAVSMMAYLSIFRSRILNRPDLKPRSASTTQLPSRPTASGSSCLHTLTGYLDVGNDSVFQHREVAWVQPAIKRLL